MLTLPAFMGTMLLSADGSTFWEQVLQPVKLSSCMPLGPLSNQNVGKGWKKRDSHRGGGHSHKKEKILS